MKETFNVLFFIQKTRPLKNGKVAIIMRITVNGQFEELRTKRQVYPKLWNQQKGIAIGKSPDLIELNSHLLSLNTRAYDVLKELDKESLPINAHSVKEGIFNKPQKVITKMFFKEFQVHNSNCEELLDKDFAKSTVDRYKLCLVYFKTMCYLEKNEKTLVTKIIEKIKSKEIEPDDFPMSDVSKQMIDNFAFFLKTKLDIGNNTTSHYLKCVQKIIKNGFENGWIHVNPFANIKFTESKGKVLFLTIEEVCLLIKKEFTIKRLDQVRDVFVFCCFTGLAFIDVWQLKKEHIIKDGKGGSWIMKERQKTKIEFDVPLLKIPLQLIEKYINNEYCLKTGKLLPVVSNQRMNGYLKEIADLCGIQKKLTTHVARHTFATSVTLANDVSIMNVSKMLGHTKLSMTQHYAKVLNKSLKKDMDNVTYIINEQILQSTKRNNENNESK